MKFLFINKIILSIVSFVNFYYFIILNNLNNHISIVFFCFLRDIMLFIIMILKY